MFLDIYNQVSGTGGGYLNSKRKNFFPQKCNGVKYWRNCNDKFYDYSRKVKNVDYKK